MRDRDRDRHPLHRRAGDGSERAVCALNIGTLVARVSLEQMRRRVEDRGSGRGL